MALVQIPVRSDIPAYEFEIVLEGQSYRLSFEYNRRLSLWTMAIKDSGGVTLVGNQPLVASWDLFGRFGYTTLPPGKFYVFDSTGKNVDPGEADLDVTHFLFYDESNLSDEAA